MSSSLSNERYLHWWVPCPLRDLRIGWVPGQFWSPHLWVNGQIRDPAIGNRSLSNQISLHGWVASNQRSLHGWLPGPTELEYLDMVLSESMRVYPPIPLHIGELPVQSEISELVSSRSYERSLHGEFLVNSEISILVSSLSNQIPPHGWVTSNQRSPHWWFPVIPEISAWWLPGPIRYLCMVELPV